jgi:hypothetical protein
MPADKASPYLISICLSVALTAVFVVTTLWCTQKCGIQYVTYDGSAVEDFPVDAVYTWVNSKDPAWKTAYAQHFPPRKLSKKRFNNNRAPAAELQTSVELLLHHCPWVRTVYIATMRPQVPPFLHEPSFADWITTGRIKVIHHDEFFEDASVLPVFNSRPIEGNLHRIPNLSKRWLYLNDDFMTGRPVEKNMLFHGGKPVVRGNFKLVVPLLAQARLKEQQHLSGWTNNGKVLGYMWYFHNDHNATPVDSDVIADVAAQPAVQPHWSRTLQSRLRDHDQIVPLGLVDNVALDAGQYVCFRDSPVKTYCKLAQGVPWHYDMSFLKKYHFFCINNIEPGKMVESLNKIRAAFRLEPLATQQLYAHAHAAAGSASASASSS